MMLHGTRVELAEAAGSAHAWLSAYLGTDVRLVHLDAPDRRRLINPAYARPGETVSPADGCPLLLTTGAWPDALNTLVAAGDHPGEGPLPMDRFRPDVVIEGTAACFGRGLLFGQNLIADGPGVIRAGDPVRVLG